jgi:glycosyltransferase involved in cell wall biosynthesis
MGSCAENEGRMMTSAAARSDTIRRVRVLHVAEPTDGGVARCVALFAADQVTRGWDVVVATPDRDRLPGQVRAAGARWRHWDATPAPGAGTPGEVTALGRMVRDVAPDVVHLHSSKAGLAGRLVLRGRTPTLFQPHAWSFQAVEGPVRAATLSWERIAARWASRLVCVSEGEREVAERAGVRGRFAVVPNGVDLARFPAADAADRAAAKERLGAGPGPLAVCVGRLHRQKGQRHLVAAWPAVAAEVPGARLALVGDGPDADGLRAAASSAAGVWLVGPSDDVRSWYAAADVVVMPSRWEGLSLALLEAMASARPVVASDVPGMRELVRDDAGALVPYGDPEALARAVVERLRDPERCAAEGAAARARVEGGYGLTTTLARLAELTVGVAGG